MIEDLRRRTGRLLRSVREPTGQITLDTAVGRWIALLSSLPEVQTIVEVGAWRGNGSTRCIASGIVRRSPSPRVWSIEADPRLAREAGRRHARNPNIEVIWGRIVGVDALDLDDLTEVEAMWAADDIRNLEEAPEVTGRLPEVIDLLILDGGEFSTAAEYDVLAPRTAGWLVLDDTGTRKCAGIVHRLVSRADTRFTPVWSSQERNGVLVARRTTVPESH